jgi:hypothetical protein
LRLKHHLPIELKTRTTDDYTGGHSKELARWKGDASSDRERERENQWFHAEKLVAKMAGRRTGLVPAKCLEEHRATHHIYIRLADGREGRCPLSVLEELNEAGMTRLGIAQGYHEGHLSPAKRHSYFAARSKYLGDLDPVPVTMDSKDDNVPSPLAAQLVDLPLEEEALEILVAYSSALHTLLARAARLEVKSIDKAVERTLRLTEICKVEDIAQLLEQVPQLRHITAEEREFARENALETLNKWYKSNIQRVAKEIQVKLELQRINPPFRGGRVETELPVDLLRRPALKELLLTVVDMGSGETDTVCVEITHEITPGRGALDVSYDRVSWAVGLAAMRRSSVIYV